MGATKIINVARDDRFEEILTLFKSATADEVIFVLPKNAKAFNREANVAALRDTATELDKKVSLLCPNPRVVALASAYGFEILPDRSSTPKAKKPKAQLASVVDDENLGRVQDDSDSFEKDVVVPSDAAVDLPDDEEEELEGIHEEDEEGADVDESPAQHQNELIEEPNEGESLEDVVAPEQMPIAHLASAATRRRLDGVAQMGNGRRNVTARPAREAHSAIPVQRGHHEQRRMAEIAQVWQAEQSAGNMWTDIPVQSPRLAGFQMNWSKRLGIIGGIVATAGLGTFIFFSTGSAQVFVTPVSRDLDLHIQATVSDTVSEVDSSLKRLPGQIFNVEKTVSQEFPSSGEKDVAQKARGKVTVSNGLSTAQTLIATTRFESSGGLIFRSLRLITVPAATVKSGTTTPGSVEVEVIADKPGKEYNVAAGAFTIPAFKEKGETERFKKITASSTVAFSGGVNGKAKVVTEVDYQTARDTVSTSAKSAVLESLKAQVGSLLVPQTSILVKAVDASAQVDQAVDSFVVSGTGAVKTVGVNKGDVEKLVAAAIAHDQHLIVVPGQLEITLGNGQFSETSGLYELAISVKGKGYDTLDEEKIVGDLMGRSETDIRNYFKSAPGVSSARVVLSPFWVRKMPKNKEKVSVEFQYE